MDMSMDISTDDRSTANDSAEETLHPVGEEDLAGLPSHVEARLIKMLCSTGLTPFSATVALGFLKVPAYAPR
jgi:hypothetical protein